uniref:Uncharacterized protein n=1 Tax=Pseudictyota dubia TaxID=2749911 RepID=A0A7R9WKH2_9STRA|mmetsp:Transcript_9376/g.17563  ORF Transcript_9376/g.17563 Transcript_9376/m.17563 type:complete len:632 (+) Transcript_9376:223-2118(+)
MSVSSIDSLNTVDLSGDDGEETVSRNQAEKGKSAALIERELCEQLDTSTYLSQRKDKTEHTPKTARTSVSEGVPAVISKDGNSSNISLPSYFGLHPSPVGARGSKGGKPVARRRSSTRKSIEKLLCEQPDDITWAVARELVLSAKGSLEIALSDAAAEMQSFEDRIPAAVEENEANPKKARPRSIRRRSTRGKDESGAGSSHGAHSVRSAHSRSSLPPTFKAPSAVGAFFEERKNGDAKTVKAAMSGCVTAAGSNDENDTHTVKSAHSRESGESVGTSGNKDNKTVARRRSSRRTSVPTIEKLLCEQLDITWAGARELVLSAKESLGIEMNEWMTEVLRKEDIIEAAIKENKVNPKKARPKLTRHLSLVRKGESGAGSTRSAHSIPRVRSSNSLLMPYTVASEAAALREKKEKKDAKMSAAAKAALSSGISAAVSNDESEVHTAKSAQSTESGGSVSTSRDLSKAKPVPLRRKSGRRTSAPTIEKELCERLDITWAGARELVLSAKGTLGIALGDIAAEQSRRGDIMQAAAKENEASPKKSRPRKVLTRCHSSGEIAGLPSARKGENSTGSSHGARCSLQRSQSLISVPSKSNKLRLTAAASVEQHGDNEATSKNNSSKLYSPKSVVNSIY